MQERKKNAGERGEKKRREWDDGGRAIGWNERPCVAY